MRPTSRARLWWRLYRTWGLRNLIRELAERVPRPSTPPGLCCLLPVSSVEFEVSVVVPTYNGAADLERLLASLGRQRGCRLEVVLVDSSSTDETLKVVERYPFASALSIASQDFSHSTARNWGVQHCQFPRVLLTVQDAEFPDEFFLHRLCALLEAQSLVAVSVAEEPRADADEFARFEIADYRERLGLQASFTLIHDGLSGSRRQRLATASLGNVACLYRTEILKRHPFEGTFGEDLLMGLKLASLRHRTALTSELTVVHSHTRSAFYVLRRQFSSSRLLAEVGLAEPPGRHSPAQANALFLAQRSIFPGGWAVVRILDPSLGSWLERFFSLEDDPTPSARQPVADASFALKRWAAQLGNLLASVRLDDWPTHQRNLVEGLAKGV